MSDWPTEKFGDFIDLETGWAFKSREFRLSVPGTLLLRGDNIGYGRPRWGEKSRWWPNLDSNLEKYLLQVGDVVVGMDGSQVGRKWAVIRKQDTPCLLVQRVARIRGRERLLQSLIPYLIQSKLFVNYVDEVKTGSSIYHISPSQIKDYEFKLPPLPEQRAIASILGALDDKIDLNRRMNETLEEMARALFKSWFVDFDPVRAKAEGKQPYGMDAETAALFPDRLVDSELGPIPEGWEVVKLTDLVELNPRYKLRKGAEANFVEMKSVPTAGHRPTAWWLREFTSGSKYKNEDTLLARITPCLENGKTAFVDFLEENEVGWGSTEFIVMRPKKPFSGFWGYCLARNEEFRSFAIQTMTGSSGRQRVQVDALANYQLTRSSDEIAGAFQEISGDLAVSIRANDLESRTLAELRDLLLPKLLSGEIRVKEAEKMVEDIA